MCKATPKEGEGEKVKAKLTLEMRASRRLKEK